MSIEIILNPVGISLLNNLHIESNKNNRLKNVSNIFAPTWTLVYIKLGLIKIRKFILFCKI